MKKIVFIGAKNIGFLCLEHLLYSQENLNFELTAVLTNDRGQDIKKLSTQRGITVLESLEQYLTLPDVDLLISVQYNEILKEEYLKKARQISVNLHMAPLPEYRGCNQFSFAIINEEKNFGTTLHAIDVGVDSGDVICERRFSIPNRVWVKELVELTETHSFEMFKEFLPKLISGDYEKKSQADLLKTQSTKFYKRNDINSIKKLDLNWGAEKLERYIRALSMPGFEGPYLIIDEKKVFINVKEY
jgi:methionyl-tRNA formyltransferase